eukprot:6413360-Prorocentrum_lima.AAC.1
MVHMLRFSPESNCLRTRYIDPRDGYVAVRIALTELVEQGRHDIIRYSCGVLLSYGHIPPEFITAVISMRNNH